MDAASRRHFEIDTRPRESVPLTQIYQLNDYQLTYS